MPRTKPDKGKGKGKGPKDVLALARARVELRWAIAEAILSTTVDAWDGGCSGGTVDAWVKATRHLLMLHGFRPGAVALDDEQLNILRDVLGDVSGVATFDFRPGALAQGGHSRSRGGGRSRSHGGRRGRPTSGSSGASNGLPMLCFRPFGETCYGFWHGGPAFTTTTTSATRTTTLSTITITTANTPTTPAATIAAQPSRIHTAIPNGCVDAGGLCCERVLL